MAPDRVLIQGGVDATHDAAPGAAPDRRLSTPTPFLGRFIRRFLFLFGVASLCYVLGAAVSYFGWPTSKFLHSAFVGGMAWYELRSAKPSPDEYGPLTVGRIDKPDKTCDGFTLVMYGTGTQAKLIDMEGHVVHEWRVSFRTVWPDQPDHVNGPVDEKEVYFNDGYIFPNGDLLAVVEGPANLHNPWNGYGLVKLDKDSKVLWKYDKNCHHDLDVGEDGRIYVIVNQKMESMPPGLEYIPTPCVVDSIHVLSAEGDPLKQVPLLEAIKDSPYAPLLSPLEKSRRFGSEAPPVPVMPAFQQDLRRMDVLHTNSVKVLSKALAPKFPMFKAGQLLVCPRNLDAITMLDPDSGKLVWAARGPWRAQHDPTFLDNGHLLLFDNYGSPQGSRVLEYDPRTQAFPWTYPGEHGTPFFSRIRGMCQRLPNGNTLIVNSMGGEFFEVTPAQELVWSGKCGDVTIYRAKRYLPEQLRFLKKEQLPRPR
jgi:hypothetical protein